MATNRPHIKLNTREQRDASVPLRFNYGFGEPEEDEENDSPDYTGMAEEFRGMLSGLRGNLQTRIRERNPALQVPAHIEYIQIIFQSQFVISDFYGQWRDEFGLLGIQFSKFGNEILFAIEDRQKFQDFMDQIDRFIRKESGEDPALTYASKIIFIQSFALLSTADMLRFRQVGALMNVQLIDDFPLSDPLYRGILTRLEQYLGDRNLPYSLDEASCNLEIQGATNVQLREIAQNYDIVLQITSSLATVVRPSAFGLAERSYGFEISNADEDLPLIGVIDTGISDQTPLAAILVNDEQFNLTETSPLVDTADHGTGVGALAALGKLPYATGFRGAVRADAKLLSIKILDAGSGFLSQGAVVNMLYRAKQAYPEMKLFVLTICYETPKEANEDYSTYAHALDRFSHETGSLVFICTGNNSQGAADNQHYDLTYFTHHKTNLCSPAESMNNMTVGAAAGTLRPGIFAGVSTSQEFPTLYSRKGHIDLAALFSAKKVNKAYFKPDLIDFGGDYEYPPGGQLMGQGLRASMQILSSDPTQSFYDHIGTSYPTPLIANLGAQVQKNYPDIRAQSIKALVINSASSELIRFPQAAASLLERTTGHGLPDDRRSVYSDDNAITFLIEDDILPEQVNIYPVHFPAYLTTEDLGKKNGLLLVTATLAFSFDPLLSHQLAYCPVHMAFAFFRNQDGNQILAPEKISRSLLKAGLRWSQSGRYVKKPIASTNVQKISFLVSRDLLLQERSTFKLAVNCRINTQLLPGTERVYQRPHPFSIAVTVAENLKENRLTGRLYAEMLACNLVENIARAEAEGIAEGEA